VGGSHTFLFSITKKFEKKNILKNSVGQKKSVGGEREIFKKLPKFD
jgi:hypothetical protein